MIAVGLHLFPFRTEKLKPPAPKILEEISGKIGRRRDIVHNIIFRSLSLNILFTCLCSYPTPWTSPIAFHTMVSSNGRRRDIVHNIYFYILSTNIFLILFSGYPTPWTSPIAFHTMVSSNGRRRDIVHNIIFRGLSKFILLTCLYCNSTP